VEGLYVGLISVDVICLNVAVWGCADGNWGGGFVLGILGDLVMCLEGVFLSCVRAKSYVSSTSNQSHVSTMQTVFIGVHSV
jgi:hypothetical protein